MSTSFSNSSVNFSTETSILSITPAILSPNTTNSTDKTINNKINCAKECPCGVPTIPVPDQWLEVMVSGGFKVWHIIFIIIALIVTLVVVYCCFHRCRIPRTKQEIEADLMRSNMTNKFRDYLQELPNEPVTFIEVLKRVQDMEEKLEKDNAQVSRDAGMRKRMGWLNLKGKNASPAADLETGQANEGEETKNEATTTTKSVEQNNIKDNLLTKQTTLTKDLTLTSGLVPTDILDAKIKDLQPEQRKNEDFVGKIINKSTVKSSLDVKDAAKLVKDQHRELRDKRSTPSQLNSTKDQQQVQNTISSSSPTTNQPADKHVVVRRRKHDKPNLSRSKMIREKTHPSVDGNSPTRGLANGHRDEKVKSGHSPTQIQHQSSTHEHAHITFEEPIIDGPTIKDTKTKKSKKKQLAPGKKPSKSSSKTKEVKKPRDKNL